MNLLRLPIDRPITTAMLFIGIALFGFISWTRIPQELFPSLEFPQITIVTKYEGAGPEESEKLISKIIEETAGTVKNIKKVSSVSKEGASIVTCEFRWGTEMNFAAMEVREKIDLIKESLPKDSRDPVVLKYNPMQVEAMILSANYLVEESDPWKMAELRQFCKKNLKDELERLDGVAKVELRGGEQKEILVEIDKGRLLANQVSITEVISSLRDANITYPAGTIKEETSEYLVKTVGEFRTMADISSLSFGKQDQGARQVRSSRRVRGDRGPSETKMVFIRDIADVRESLRDVSGYSRHNRKDNISLGIYPQSGSNLIKTSDSIKKKLAELQSRVPANIEVQIIYDQSDFVKSSLDNIYSSALQGGVLSFILLYLFMKSVAGSLIIIVSIPVSVLITLSLMYFNDITINTMSLGGLTIGIGMVIDNSNMVMENILLNYHKNPKRDKRDIIYEATVSLVPAIISSTLTTVAIFLPFIFVAGMIGQLFKQLALTITFSMIASVFAAIFLVPRLVLHLDFSKQSIEVGNKPIEKHFVPMLNKVLAWPIRKMAFFTFLYMAAGIGAFLVMQQEFMPKVDERRFVLNVNMHPETPLGITNSVVKRIEDTLAKHTEIKDISTTVGSTGDKMSSASVETLESNQARIIARLSSKGLHTEELVATIASEIRKWNVKDLETEFITQQGLFGSGVGASSGVTIEVKGKDLAVLRESAVSVKEVMDKMPEFYGIRINPSDLVPELRIVIDREKASLFGLSTQDISAMTLAAIKGYVATKLKTKENEYDIRVRMREQDRDSIEKVTEMTAYSPWGMTILLKQISTPLYMKTIPQIKRSEGQRTYSVNANIEGSFSGAVKKLQENLSKLPAKEDVYISVGGEMLAMTESMQSSVFAMLLGVVIIYMILASQFESLFQPLIVMTAVPLALIGAVFTLLVTFQSINAISMLGMIMLVGNAVNMSILLVDRYNTTYSKNSSEGLNSVVVRITAEHLRPIIMTTLTTITGMLPLALGIGEGASSTQSMAIAEVGGLMFALVLSVFFVPFVYMAARTFDFTRLFKRLFGKKDAYSGNPQG